MKKIMLFLAVALLSAPAASFAQKMTVTNINREKTYKTTERTVDVWYQGELNVGYGLDGKVDGEDAKFGRVFVETIHGARITKYAFVGLGLGVQYATDWESITMPAFVDLKGYYPVTEKFAPYVNVDLGYTPVLDEGKQNGFDGGFYAAYGVGLNYGKLNFGIGCQHQALNSDYACNSFFVKVGLKF